MSDIRRFPPRYAFRVLILRYLDDVIVVTIPYGPTAPNVGRDPDVVMEIVTPTEDSKPFSRDSSFCTPLGFDYPNVLSSQADYILMIFCLRLRTLCLI